MENEFSPTPCNELIFFYGYSQQDIEAFREEFERRQQSEASPSKAVEVKNGEEQTQAGGNTEVVCN